MRLCVASLLATAHRSMPVMANHSAHVHHLCEAPHRHQLLLMVLIIYPIGIRHQINRIPSQPTNFLLSISSEELIFQRCMHLGERNTQIQSESHCAVSPLRCELNCTS